MAGRHNKWVQCALCEQRLNTQRTMRIDTKKRLREVAGEHIVIGQAEGTADMTKVVGLNESAVLLYKRLEGRDFVLADVVQVLCDEYDVDPATARHDAEAWVAAMREQGLLL